MVIWECNNNSLNWCKNVKDEKQILQELQQRKTTLIQQIKNLDKEKEKGNINPEEYKNKKREIERELVEIMDRLTQLAFLLG